MQPITDTKLLAIAPDGEPLRSWGEGDKIFREIYTYVRSKSGINYGVINVIEITSTKKD
jgi:hypothetical protein